jgi:hypothetical protein
MSTPLRRSGARPASSAFGLLLALVLGGAVSACGDDGGTASDPAGTTSTSDTETPTQTPTETPTETPSPSESPSEEPTGGAGSSPIRVRGSAGVTDAVVVDATEGGGSASTMAFALDTDRAVGAVVGGLQGGLPKEVAAAVDQLRAPGATPYGAVVSTGCEPPRSVAIDAGEAGFQVVPQLPKNTVQCLAPVTYVVVFAAPNA